MADRRRLARSTVAGVMSLGRACTAATREAAWYELRHAVRRAMLAGRLVKRDGPVDLSHDGELVYAAVRALRRTS